MDITLDKKTHIFPKHLDNLHFTLIMYKLDQQVEYRAKTWTSNIHNCIPYNYLKQLVWTTNHLYFCINKYHLDRIKVPQFDLNFTKIENLNDNMHSQHNINH